MYRINKKACTGMVLCCPNRMRLAPPKSPMGRVMDWELRRSERVRNCMFQQRSSRLRRFPHSLLVVRRNVGRGWQRVSQYGYSEKARRKTLNDGSLVSINSLMVSAESDSGTAECRKWRVGLPPSSSSLEDSG